MALPKLGAMSDADYKLLSPEQLMLYNKDLPQFDYDKPYSHQAFPKMVYRPRTDGSRRLQSQVCDDDKKFAKLTKDGWKESPADFGVITAPAAPQVSETSLEIAMPEEDKAA